MSKYEGLRELSDEKFRRLTGVKHKTFDKMAEILKEAHAKKRKKADAPTLYVLNIC